MTFDVFREDRSNIFQEKATIPSYTGVYGTKAYVNSAKVRNQGVDASIDFGHQFNKEFSMTFKGTFTYAHNEIRKYEEAIRDYPNLSRVGYSVSQQWGYLADYLFADDVEVANNPAQMIGGTVGAGDIKYINIPNRYGEYDQVIDQNDRMPIGDPTTPEIVYGFGPSSIGEASISLSFCQGSSQDFFVLERPWLRLETTARETYNVYCQRPLESR